MKKIISIACIFLAFRSNGQTAYSNYQKCLESIDQQAIRASNDIEDKWYEENPNPKKYAYMACDGHGPKFQCRRHHKQCMNACDCYKGYTGELKVSDERFKSMKQSCENNYKKAQAEENAKAERERKLQEEKEEKARIEREKKEKKDSDVKNEKTKEDKSKTSETKADEKTTTSQKSSSDTTKKSGSAKAYNPYEGMTSEQIARKARTDEQRKIDQSEDRTYAETATAVGTAMMLINDAYVDDVSNLKLQLGLGYESLPVVANDFGHAKSSVQLSNFPNINGGIECRLNLTKKGGIALHVNPFVSYGWGAFSAGESGTSLTYGANAALFLSSWDDSKLHLFAEGGYAKRSGNWHSDLDAVLFTSTDIVYDAAYDYSILRYGGGFKLQFVNDDNDPATETYVKTGVFLERPSFLEKNAKPVLIGNIQFMISSFVMLDFSYGMNYPIAGDIRYANNFDNHKENYFSIKLVRKGLIAPHD